MLVLPWRLTKAKRRRGRSEKSPQCCGGALTCSLLLLPFLQRRNGGSPPPQPQVKPADKQKLHKRTKGPEPKLLPYINGEIGLILIRNFILLERLVKWSTPHISLTRERGIWADCTQTRRSRVQSPPRTNKNIKPGNAASSQIQ
ncbi:hypothetical protein BS50DRAFT_97684 [Corynespora cassiicola Philippines]|uniref:Uncharacterized protein n=1 Tax=Corynespora cassiicola Philippines TaxID=1448308 RepID=A0A2T2NF71_CORCC|nr:hypothetical protein BS50DRAFT_97684 [Corynespora cassiicola Philippines]